MNKDWTGNKKSTFVTLGASNHSNEERATRDYYATDPIAIDKLLKVETLSKHIWEPACGGGHLSKRLEDYGYNVWSTDLENQYTNENLDFLGRENNIKREGDIITNPPYKFAKEFMEQGIKCLANTGDKLILFLKITFLEGKARRKLFDKYPPSRIWVSSERLKCAKNGEFEATGSSAACYAWFVWEKGNTKKTELGWI